MSISLSFANSILFLSFLQVLTFILYVLFAFGLKLSKFWLVFVFQMLIFLLSTFQQLFVVFYEPKHTQNYKKFTVFVQPFAIIFYEDLNIMMILSFCQVPELKVMFYNYQVQLHAFLSSIVSSFMFRLLIIPSFDPKKYLIEPTLIHGIFPFFFSIFYVLSSFIGAFSNEFIFLTVKCFICISQPSHSLHIFRCLSSMRSFAKVNILTIERQEELVCLIWLHLKDLVKRFKSFRKFFFLAIIKDWQSCKLQNQQNVINLQVEFIKQNQGIFEKFFHILQFSKNMETQQLQKALKLKDLPVHLQRKYKNSILFEKQNQVKSKKFNFDVQKLKQRKAQKQKTIQQKLEQYKINQTQQKYLIKVFQNLASPNNGQYFTKKQISEVLRKMNIKMTNAQIDRMIWEFDEKLNKKISYKEFANMYKKCTIDKTAAQSKNLFHLTQFLMFCRPNYYRITVEDMLQLLYVRAKIEAQITKGDEKQLLQDQIKVIFGNQQKTPDGVQKEIGFNEYLQKINKRAIEKRKEQLLKAKSNLKY